MAPLHGAGLPHSEIPGSTGICPYPGLIAACHVLRRLPKPRHPPSALLSLLLFFSIARRGTRPRARAVACLPAARHAPPPASSSSFQLVKDLSPPRPPFREGAGERPAGALPRAEAGSCRTAAPPPRRVEDKGLEPLASCVQGRRSEPTELIPRERSPRQS